MSKLSRLRAKARAVFRKHPSAETATIAGRTFTRPDVAVRFTALAAEKWAKVRP